MNRLDAIDTANGNIIEKRLEFENPEFLHDLLANDIKSLTIFEKKLGVSCVSRDGWVQFSGSVEGVQKAVLAMQDLETAKRAGAVITSVEFDKSIEFAGSDLGSVSKMKQVQLPSSNGKKPVSPRTLQQMMYIQQMVEHDVVFGIGPAGTGKTYLAVAVAISLLKQKKISKIILTRPAVEAGEALGFLPGDLQEKVAPYLRPLNDAIHDMVTVDEARRYMEDNTIEIAPLAYMRGRTLRDAFVILDEGQNTTCEQMFMFLTRLGEGSKCCVTGDISQIDLRPNVHSGLIEAIAALKSIDGIGHSYFTSKDVVRHPMVAKIIDAYDVHRKK